MSIMTYTHSNRSEVSSLIWQSYNNLSFQIDKNKQNNPKIFFFLVTFACGFTYFFHYETIYHRRRSKRWNFIFYYTNQVKVKFEESKNIKRDLERKQTYKGRFIYVTSFESASSPREVSDVTAESSEFDRVDSLWDSEDASVASRSISREKIFTL